MYHDHKLNTQEEVKKDMSKFSKHINKRIKHIEKHHLNSDYTSGFSTNESGACCDKCRMDKKAVAKSGRAVALRLAVGCTDPFQIKCKCHIPYRKVAIASELALLKELKWYLEVRPDLL